MCHGCDCLTLERVNTPSSAKAAPFPAFNPQRLDVRNFARQEARLSGTRTLAQLPRLAVECFETRAEQLQDIVVAWFAQGQWREITGGAGQTWMQLSAQVNLPSQCQRCLGAYEQTVAVDRPFRFVADEVTAQSLDDEAEEDVLVASKAFDLFELIEDELLMAMPLVPLHAVCPNPLPASVHLFEPQACVEESVIPVAKNPFAVLQSLRAGEKS
jgi:uncharacterized protein